MCLKVHRPPVYIELSIRIWDNIFNYQVGSTPTQKSLVLTDDLDRSILLYFYFLFYAPV